MKNRSQPFDCPIAAKSVGISLRHGGGLQEPDHVYVRCDERDCQHVDLNLPPCPLRVDMFADGSDRRVAEHLEKHAGTRHCYACLTALLGITHDQVRRASWRFKDADGFSIRPSRCAMCQRRRVTIGLRHDATLASSRSTSAAPVATPPVADAGASAPVVDESGARTPIARTEEESAAAEAALQTLAAHLRGRAGYTFCTHCLARDLHIEIGVLREVMWKLESHESFVIRTAQCVSCLLTKRAIRFQDVAEQIDHARPVITFLLESPGLAFCPTCVAFSTDVSLMDAKRVLSDLEPVEQFTRRDGACHACGRWQTVVSFSGSVTDDGDRVAEVGEMYGGQTHYRGFRIDVASFRTAEGWRALALVQTARGAHAPPTIFLELMRTKAEADELAADKVREWIDKQSI